MCVLQKNVFYSVAAVHVLRTKRKDPDKEKRIYHRCCWVVLFLDLLRAGSKGSCCILGGLIDKPVHRLTCVQESNWGFGPLEKEFHIMGKLGTSLERDGTKGKEQQQKKSSKSPSRTWRTRQSDSKSNESTGHPPETSSRSTWTRWIPRGGNQERTPVIWLFQSWQIIVCTDVEAGFASRGDDVTMITKTLSNDMSNPTVRNLSVVIEKLNRAMRASHLTIKLNVRTATQNSLGRRKNSKLNFQTLLPEFKIFSPGWNLTSNFEFDCKFRSKPQLSNQFVMLVVGKGGQRGAKTPTSILILVSDGIPGGNCKSWEILRQLIFYFRLWMYINYRMVAVLQGNSNFVVSVGISGGNYIWKLWCERELLGCRWKDPSKNPLSRTAQPEIRTKSTVSQRNCAKGARMSGRARNSEATARGGHRGCGKFEFAIESKNIVRWQPCQLHFFNKGRTSYAHIAINCRPICEWFGCFLLPVVVCNFLELSRSEKKHKIVMFWIWKRANGKLVCFSMPIIWLFGWFLSEVDEGPCTAWSYSFVAVARTLRSAVIEVVVYAAQTHGFNVFLFFCNVNSEWFIRFFSLGAFRPTPQFVKWRQLKTLNMWKSKYVATTIHILCPMLCGFVFFLYKHI